MFTSIGLTVLVSCFLIGVGLVVMIAMRAGRSSRVEGSIAQVLYNAEHPEKTQ